MCADPVTQQRKGKSLLIVHSRVEQHKLSNVRLALQDTFEYNSNWLLDSSVETKVGHTLVAVDSF